MEQFDKNKNNKNVLKSPLNNKIHVSLWHLSINVEIRAALHTCKSPMMRSREHSVSE